MKRFLVLLALLACPALHAQQLYDFDVTIGPAEWSGSFDYTAAGNCPSSAAFCAQGNTPQFTNVDVSGMGGDYTQLQGFGGPTQWQLIGPQEQLLTFTTNAPMGGELLQVLSASFTQDYNFIQSCDPCTNAQVVDPQNAPELGWYDGAAALMILAGAILIWRGRHSTREWQ